MKPLHTLIQQVEIFDGTGAPSFHADVALAGTQIVALAEAGSLSLAQADALPSQAYQINASTRCIDGRGLALAPGFIDVHTHDDREALDHPCMRPKLTQGVTTVITGNCGISLAPWQADRAPPAPLSLIGTQNDYRYAQFADYLNALQQAQPALNVAAMVGHSTLRVACMEDLSRAANSAELAAMQDLLEQAMQAGAFGFSSGLFYPTAKASPNSEVIALAQIAGRHAAVYTSHIRDEYDGVIAALAEACDAGQQAQVPVVLSHHKCAGPKNWGRSTETLDYIRQRQRSQAVALDAYPYTAGSTVLDPDYVDGVIRIMITFSEPHPEMQGRDLAEIAASWQVDQKTAAQRLLPAGAVYFQMDEADVQRILSYPYTMIGSDGLPHDAHPHPRLWGAFPRVLGHYAREQKLFSFAAAIHKMTGLSAAQFGLSRRGRIATGLQADLVLFDPQTISDQASFAEPKRAAKGIHAVWVNGGLALEQGQLSAQRYGQVLRRQAERFGAM